ncbi:MAG: hypothetical protein KDD84_00810, partial [Caldilineaceae bacterium]|nr:hypothetical protein [Caldilineaceae bacterium]
MADEHLRQVNIGVAKMYLTACEHCAAHHSIVHQEWNNHPPHNIHTREEATDILVTRQIGLAYGLLCGLGSAIERRFGDVERCAYLHVQGAPFRGQFEDAGIL